ncbi:fimbrial protein [Klebsiella oxytoca]|nr:fimbrial protein [Klebsiella oxytoca]
MRKILTLLMALLLAGWSFNALSTSCKTRAGAQIPPNSGGGTANVYISLDPSIGAEQNLVIDLSTQIFCMNELPEYYTDYLSLGESSTFGSVLKNFRGIAVYDGSSYAFPNAVETKKKVYKSTDFEPWPLALYLTPIGAAGGVVVNAGELIAILRLHQTNNFGDSHYFIWNLYANNNVVVPTGGCNVSARDVTVTLPDYPGSIEIPLSVYCAQNQNLEFYVSGLTTDSANSIFTNTASASPAGGIGVQLKHKGSVLSTSNTVSLGTVGTSAVDLGLSATYARTSGQVTAGNVQSIIGVTFVYQ